MSAGREGLALDIVVARTFLAAVAAGSFAEAAQRVNASPSAVTERIKQLEHQLNVQLFERDKRGCRLTAAGRRFVTPAQNMISAWEQGCARVALPSIFSESIRVGGQHIFWPNILVPWLQEVRARRPDLAIRAISATPQRLNRDLENDDIDIAFQYDPMRRRGLRVEELFPDRLVMVSARPDLPWHDNFVRIDWGDAVAAELAARLGDLPNAGLELDMGPLSIDWLVASGGSGFMPERIAAPYIAAGQVSLLEDMPAVEFSSYVCWRGNLSDSLVGLLIDVAKSLVPGADLAMTGLPD